MIQMFNYRCVCVCDTRKEKNNLPVVLGEISGKRCWVLALDSYYQVSV